MLSIVKQLESQGSFVSDNLKDENNYKDGTYTYILYEINKNIPLMGAVEPQQGYEVDIFTPQASFISVLCYNDKLISIDAQGLYDYKELKKRKIISKKEAIAIANKELNSLSPNNTYQIDKAYIEYVEIPDYTSSIYLPKKMQPYWCIILKNALNDVRTYRINAYTGGDLSYGE